MNTELGYLPTGFLVTLYYSIITIIGLTFFIFIKKDKFSIFLFMIFFSGVFSAIGELFDNLFKILLLFFSFLLLFDTKQKLNINTTLVAIFLLFSISFSISIYVNRNPILYSISQYSKYLIPFIIYHFIINKLTDIISSKYYLHLIVKLILLQVLFSVVKLFTIGFSESIVGSIAYMGGNSASILPIIGLLIVYTLNKDNIGKSEIFQIASFTLISIMSFKRIIWFLLPIFLVILNIIFGHVKHLKYVLIAAPIIFYLGVRLNPTLNKEEKIWGSFDLEYVIWYVQDYYGLNSNNQIRDESFGRVGGNEFMINYVKAYITDIRTWFGYGPKAIYGLSYTEYEKQKFKWGVSGKGSLGGAARFLIAYGLAGMFFYLALIINFFYKNDNIKIRHLLIGFFLLEFFFYLDTLIYLPIIISLLIFSNYLTISNIEHIIKTLKQSNSLKGNNIGTAKTY